MSHTFWPLRQLRDHEAAGLEHIFTPEAVAADKERLEWFRNGDHAQVLDTMGDFYRYRPEARFGHYLMMMGALGRGRLHRDRPPVRRVRELDRDRPGARLVRPPRRRLPAAHGARPQTPTTSGRPAGPDLPAAG